MIEITNRCNLRCVHCGSSSGSAREDEMSTGELMRVVDEVGEMGCEAVTLLGGEPLLHRDRPNLVELGHSGDDAQVIDHAEPNPDHLGVSGWVHLGIWQKL